MKCEKCKKPLADNLKFCSECGTPAKPKQGRKKKKLTLNIDETVLKKAKEEIPNISQLVEETLRTYLDAKDSDEFRLRTQIKAEEEQIERSQTQIELINAQLKLRRDSKYGEKAEQDRAWRAIWDNYRNFASYSDEAMDNAVRVLGWDKERIHNLAEGMKALGRFINGVKAQTWEYAKEQEKNI